MIPMYVELNAGRNTLILIPHTDYANEDDLRYQAKYLSTLTPLFSPSTPPGGLLLPLSWPAVVQLVNSFGSYLSLGERLREWMADYQAAWQPGAHTFSVTLPDGLTPRSYQVAGAGMIASSGHVLLTDDPGVGKTVTTLLGLAQREQDGHQVRPLLVVCPASVIHSWIDHVKQWCPQWTPAEWRGPKRMALLEGGDADVFVTSYATLRADARNPRKPLKKLAPVGLVFDECHALKDPGAQQTKAARIVAHSASTVVALSGTPVTRTPADLYPVLDILFPAAWPSRDRWVDRYCLTAQREYGVDVIGLNPGTEPELRTSLYGRMRRVAKADVLTELPPKIYSTRTVEIPREWRHAYDTMANTMTAQLPDGSDLPAMEVIAQLLRLNQLACSAADVEVTMELDEETGFERPRYAVTLKSPSWKVDALLEILAERPGQQTLVFAPSAQLIRIAGDEVRKAGYRTNFLIGDQSATVRTASVEAFQDGKLDVLCATTGAGGVGLTLTAASTVVFLQRPWSLVESLQAEDRAHRIGSERHDAIEIIDIVTANTIDSHVRAALRDKAGQLAEVVQDRRIVTTLLGGREARAT